jgi:polyhydroxyalkanoate synthesis repressor PhaR
LTSEDQQPRVIKKYPNRRLYDTDSSRYVTLAEVRQLVVDAIPFVVIEQKTEQDITRSILLQIILDQESETNPLFSNENLERFIRYYKTAPEQGFSEFIGQSLQFFHDQQRDFSKTMGGLAGQSPMTAWADLTQKNMEAWNKMMGITPNTDSKKD